MKMSKKARAKINAKRDYGKEYERDQKKRSGYSAALNKARRKRGIYGKGGPDMSHTKEGGLVAESPSANRARNGKGKRPRLK